MMKHWEKWAVILAGLWLVSVSFGAATNRFDVIIMKNPGGIIVWPDGNQTNKPGEGAGSGDLTEVQTTGVGLSVSSGTGPIPVLFLTNAALSGIVRSNAVLQFNAAGVLTNVIQGTTPLYDASVFLTNNQPSVTLGSGFHVNGAATVGTSLIVTNGFTLVGGTLTLPANSIADSALSANVATNYNGANDFGHGYDSATRTLFPTNFAFVFSTGSGLTNLVTTNTSTITVTYYNTNTAGSASTTNTISEVLTAGNNAGGLTMTNLGALYMAGKILLNGSSTIFLDLPNGKFQYGTTRFLDLNVGRLQLLNANSYIQENQLFGAGVAWEAHNFSGNTLPAFRGRTYGAGHAMSFLSNTTEVAYIDNFGRFTTRGSAAPTDALTPTNHVAIWFDSSAGAAFLCFKGRDASGTIVTNRIELNP